MYRVWPIVNKMDILGADFYNVLNMMKERLKTNAVPDPASYRVK